MPEEKKADNGKYKNLLVIDDDDCDRPACDDMVSKIKAAASAAATSNKKTTTSPADKNNESKTKTKPCPPGSGELGKSTWNLLHSMAAWYPDKPTVNEQKQMHGFMTTLAKFYPCLYCAQDFQQNQEVSPPNTKSRKELCQWLCQQHNLVNKKLGKRNYPCDMKTLDDRWRKSDRDECQGHGLHR